MLKSIATARSECTEKHKNKANFNTDYIFPGFMAMIEKKIKTQIKKYIFIFVKNIGLLLVISEHFLSTIQKNNVLAICISY